MATPVRPSNAPSNGNGQDSTGTFAIYEDTQFEQHDVEATQFAVHEDTTLFGGRKQPPGDHTGDFVCYEDTELLGETRIEGDAPQMHVLQPSALGNSPDSATGFGGVGADSSIAYLVYEDTELL